MKENVQKKEFRVPSNFSKVPKTSQDVLGFLGPLGLNEDVRFDIRLCLEEALINAMKYGHGMDERLEVRIAVEFDAERIGITIEDQGQGFDPNALKDCTQEGNLLETRGRGVYLIHKLMDEVEYNDKGNVLKMVKFLSKQRKLSADRGV